MPQPTTKKVSDLSGREIDSRFFVQSLAAPQRDRIHLRTQDTILSVAENQ